MNQQEQARFDEQKATIVCLTEGLLDAQRDVATLVTNLNEACAQASLVVERLNETMAHAIIKHGVGDMVEEVPREEKNHPLALDILMAAVGAALPFVIAEGSTPKEITEDLIRQAGALADKATHEAGTALEEGYWLKARNTYEMARLMSPDASQRDLLKQQSAECHKHMLEARVHRRSRN